jgi:hypothetical protein
MSGGGRGQHCTGISKVHFVDDDAASTGSLVHYVVDVVASTDTSSPRCKTVCCDFIIQNTLRSHSHTIIPCPYSHDKRAWRLGPKPARWGLGVYVKWCTYRSPPGHPFSIAHLSTSSSPFSAACSHVSSSHGQWFSRAHFNTSR